MARYTPPRASATRSFTLPPTHSSGSPWNVLANSRRSGSSCSIPPPRPRVARNSAPFLLRDRPPPVLVLSNRIVARPVSGSSFITLPASLFAKRIEPPSPAIGPSALLPSHDQTTFQDWPRSEEHTSEL